MRAATAATSAAVPDESLGAAFSRLATEEPRRPALSFDGRIVTRDELDRAANRLARAYAAHGVTAGSFVTIALPNSIEFFEAVLATWKLGATPQPVSHRLSAAERHEIMILADPALVVGVDTELGEAAPCLPTGFTPAPDLAETPLPNIASPSWKAPTSGGSTGRPKLIVAGERGVTSELDMYSDLYRIEPDTVMLMTGPLYHNGPFMNSFLTLLRGGHVVLMPRFEAEPTLELIERHHVTSLYAVPTMMHRIWRLAEAVRLSFDVTSLRNVLHTAAPCPSWLKQEWIDWLGPDVIFEIYGGTEAQAMTALLGSEWMLHPGSVGRVRLGEMVVLDDSGRPCPPGVTGAIWLRRGPGVPATYQYVGAQARTRDGGWEWLGDSGHFDADGYLFVADRATDLIIVGGANVYPAEVEAVVDAHPLVSSCCVIGLPDADLGQVPHAIVQLLPDARPACDTAHEKSLHEHVASRLVSYKRPRSYEFVTDSLRDDSGKVRRIELRTARTPPPEAESH